MCDAVTFPRHDIRVTGPGEDGVMDDDARDGRHDFDFLAGRWRIANRRIEDPLGEGPRAWLEFSATGISTPILGGLGNHDTYSAPAFPGRPGFEGFTLRLFDPTDRVWRIWWASSAGGGHLDTPVVGRFVDGQGRFECDDVVGNTPVVVRYVWNEITTDSARWEQSFSEDGGRTFEVNWVMSLTRMP